MTESFDLETRKKIYQLIIENPGLNLSTIAELLSISVPLVDYHTRHMNDDSLITIVKEGGYKRYYIQGDIGIKDKKFLAILRQETPLKIVLFLLEHPYSQHKEILKQFDLAPSTLTYHLTKLVNNQIIFLDTSEEGRGYCVINRKEVIRFLIQYKPSKILRRFKETWADDFQLP
jgi:predicted transcriptional regulator